MSASGDEAAGFEPTRAEGAGREVPGEFVGFVRERASALLASCQELTGSARAAVALRLDLLATVALRWRWWSLRGRWPRARMTPRALAARRLDTLLKRESVNWRSDLTGGRIRVITDPDEAATIPVAADAWRRARRLRATRRLILVTIGFGLACVGLVAPREPAPNVLPPPLPGPTLPAGVRVLPRFAELSTLDILRTDLPPTVSVEPTRAAPLAARPLSRAYALLREDLGPLLIVGADGTRFLDDPSLAGARLLTTSLSPDGTLAVLAMSNGLLVVDLATGALRPIPLATPVPSLAWYAARSVLVPVAGAALRVDVDTAQSVRVPGVNAVDAVTAVRGGLGPLVELTSRSSTVGANATIRVWRTVPDATPGTASGAAQSSTPTPSTSAQPRTTSDVEERPVFGPAWIGRWTGPAWSTADLLARVCSPSTVTLPPEFGVARSAIGAIGSNGLYAGTLVTVDNVTLDVLGFAGPQVALLAASASDASMVIAWQPRTGVVRRVMALDRFARMSLPDLTMP